MTDLTNKTNDELVELGRAVLLEAEARLTADGTHPRVLKRVKLAHAHLDDAVSDLVGGGIIQPMSVGGDKT